MMKEFLPSCAICDLYPIYFIPRWAFVGLACQEWHNASASVELPTSLNLGTRNALYRRQCFSTYKYFSIMQTVWLVLPQQHQQHWGDFLSKLFDRDVSNIPSLPGTKAQRAGSHCWFCVTVHQQGSGLVFISRGSTWRNLHCCSWVNCCIPQQICLGLLWKTNSSIHELLHLQVLGEISNRSKYAF